MAKSLKNKQGFQWNDRKNIFFLLNYGTYLEVLRIRFILVRIRICGSVPRSRTNGSGSCYFREWPSRWQQQFFGLLIFEVTFTSFLKIKSYKEVTRQ
jgi:hypothetical protein